VKLKERYPKLIEKLGDEDTELRHVLTIDENMYDFDSEEFEYHSDEYNYLVYVADPLQRLLGEEGMIALAEYLASYKGIDDFLVGEEDLFALKTGHDDAFLADIILSFVQEQVC